MLYYIRNSIDDLIGFTYNDTIYYYIKNIQNDIIGILDNNYTQIANYEYDAYGNILSITDQNGLNLKDNKSHIANINPFRYRSYYYDKETNLYYLNSRYYNPEWGRFLNIDVQLATGSINLLGINLYIYTENNPIMNVDSTGKFFKKIGSFFNSAVNNWIDGMKYIGKQVANAGKQIIQGVPTVTGSVASTISGAINGITNSFIAEVGIGTGAVASVNKVVQIGAYQDVTWTYKKGEITEQLIGEIGISGLGLGISDSYVHQYPFDSNELGYQHFATDFGIISHCSQTTHTNNNSILGIVQFSGNKTFIGLDISTHAYIGGHIKIGFEF